MPLRSAATLRLPATTGSGYSSQMNQRRSRAASTSSSLPVYVGTRGSSVDFDSNEGYDGSLELIITRAGRVAIGDTDFGIDVGYIYYDYPGDNGNNGDYQEFYVSGSWKDFRSASTTPDDYYAETDEFWYYAADYSLTRWKTQPGLPCRLQPVGGGRRFSSSDDDNYTDYSVTPGPCLGRC